MAGSGCNWPQTAGRSGCLKIRQRLAVSSWVQRTPAGLPPGMPGRLALAGMAELIDGAMQHAPQPGRQCKLLAAAVRE